MHSAQHTRTGQIPASEESFFSTLLAADRQMLPTKPANDFVIIDIMSGQAARREITPAAMPAGIAQMPGCPGSGL
jgi:hypothetical protein